MWISNLKKGLRHLIQVQQAAERRSFGSRRFAPPAVGRYENSRVG